MKLTIDILVKKDDEGKEYFEIDPYSGFTVYPNRYDTADEAKEDLISRLNKLYGKEPDRVVADTVEYNTTDRLLVGRLG